MKYMREKRLCYYCDFKWNLGHKWKNLRLFFIEEVKGDDEDEEGTPVHFLKTDLGKKLSRS